MSAESPLCPACAAKRRHTPEDWKAFHPHAGHGYTEGQGWTHPDLDPANQPVDLESEQ